LDFQTLLLQEGVSERKGKGEHVFMQGEKSTSLYYIQSGLLKAYYTSKDGKESVKSFISSHNIIGSLSAVVLEKDCSFSLVCLEESSIRKIPFEIILDYSQKDLEIANNMIEVLINFSIKKEQREFELLCLSAEERFRELIKSYPTLPEKVTQNDLARFLGVTPVGLSRIKKRVLNCS